MLACARALAAYLALRLEGLPIDRAVLLRELSELTATIDRAKLDLSRPEAGK